MSGHGSASSSMLDVHVLQLAVERGIIAQTAAGEVLARAGKRPLGAAMVEDGLLSVAQLRELRAESERRSLARLVAGYEIQGRVGRGAMATVYRAVEVKTGRRVALKVMASRLAGDRNFVERFLREARAAASVSHPNLVGCCDYGEWQGRLYMALEYVAGGDAAALAKGHHDRLGETRAMRIGLDCARGLCALHQAGLIHRDVKPSNIFLDHEGRAKLADFGLARPVEQGGDRLTRPGTVLGTPSYMSPEQVRAIDDIDIRADIYSLGASLYHLICGERPFDGATPYEQMAKVLSAPLVDPRGHAPELSAGGAAVIMKAMAHDREHRYAHPAEMVEDLESILAGRSPQHAMRRLASRRWPWWLAAGLAVTGTAAVLVFRYHT